MEIAIAAVIVIGVGYFLYTKVLRPRSSSTPTNTGGIGGPVTRDPTDVR